MEDSTTALNKALKHNKRLKQLLKKHQHFHNMQDALIQLSEQASTVSELTLLYPAIHQILEAYLPSKNFYVVLLDEKNQQLELNYFIDEKDPIFVPLTDDDHFSHGLTGYVFKTGKTQLYNKKSMLNDHQLGKFKIKGSPCEHWLGIPIYKDEKIVGVMVTQSYYAEQSYTDTQVELVEIISLYLSTAIERVKQRESLEQEVKTRTSELTKANKALKIEIEQRKKALKQQQILFKISELATQSKNLDDFYFKIHKIIKSITYADNLYICLYDKNKNKLTFPYAVDSLEGNYADRYFAKGYTEYVISKSCTQLLNRRTASNLIKQGLIKRSEKNIKATSWVGAPLISEQGVIGIIACQSYDNTYTFKTHDADLITFVSQQIANVLQKHLTTAQLKQSHEQLEQRVTKKTQELQRSNHFLQLQIEERKKIEQQLYHDAHHDPLTGLANRSLFMSQLEQALNQHLRHPQPGFAVLFIDLDNFKEINDTFGHQVGDLFLIHIADSLNLCIREHDLLARLGGDEFVILLTHIYQKHEAQEVAERIIDSLSCPFNANDSIITSGASIGITCSHQNYQHTDEIMKDADTAMYQAKKTGRGRYEFYHAHNKEAKSQELAYLDLFHINDIYFKANAIIDNTNENHVACIIDRFWLHPTLGKIRFDQIEKYINKDYDYHQIEISLLPKINDFIQCKHAILINSSIKLITDNYFVNLITELKKLKISHQLCLLFNEIELRHINKDTRNNILKLKKQGIKIGLDDYAHTRCDLSILTQYQFDFILLSPLMCKKIIQDEGHQLQLQGILAVANLTQASVIAKGPSILNYQKSLKKYGISLYSSQYEYIHDKVKNINNIYTHTS
ncbi:sensor domain-containing diguanylate cyclase [Pseudoalteromonas denitrificans]|uniref:Diguanylate cyclase (GGDEF) domain-containing protein n=1 Tax=Pseudoalteromonas denitrificans DSM 6059 TaxID=1123010 RepID=A0A1I1KAJ0_9GAMM|nr:diguanylate cyclase [Pseudoalteromonas denitrificans]SFC54550.1 diguanylate cyclase (GGDEF) domain-containing protein [Pseudoalteromonas denitrificans DSM 6059]